MSPSLDLDTHTTELPVRGIKRKATFNVRENAKRFRENKTTTDFGSLSNASHHGSWQTLTHRLDSDPSDYDFDSTSDADDRSHITSSVTTPLTPISSKASPRHPSDLLKIHRCTHEGCDKSFNRPAKLAQHLRSHTNTRPFICPHPLCNKDFLRESHLKHHVKSAHSDVRDYVCGWEDCGKSFVTATRLKRHHAAHEGRERFRCTVAGCGQAFRKHGTLQRHILIVHEGRKPYVCQVLDVDGTECGAGFDTEGQLKAHAGRVHESNTFFCTICPSEVRSTISRPSLDYRQPSFSTYAALREHVEIVHPPACTECGQKCKSLRDLKSHLEVIHGVFDVNDQRVHSCHEQGCGRSFTKKGNLRMHIHISHGPIRFACGEIDPSTPDQVADWDRTDSCGKILTTKASLEEHIRTAHQGLARSGETTRQNKNGAFDEQARKHEVTVLTRITGAGYEEERTIQCLVIGCNHRFLREYDLEIHLQCRHGLAMMINQGRGYNQEGMGGDPTLGMQFDDDIGTIGREESLGAGALRGGSSWVEEQSYLDRGESDEWLRDELEMRCLIGGGLGMERDELGGGHDDDIIDPTLQ